MIFKVIVLLTVILGTTLGAHLLLYKATVSFWGIASPLVKSILLVGLVLLALSFMASFFLLRMQENQFTIGFYIFAATWTGLLFNLLLAAGACWLLISIIRITGHHPNTRWIAAVGLLLAVIYTAFGIWNALHPRVKDITVTLKGLPHQWQNKTIVQLSDIHLGHVHGQRFLDGIIDKVNTIQPEIILITGDLFDGMDASFYDLAKPLDKLSAPQGVYFVTGNHETYVGLKRALHVLSQTKIRVLNNEVINIDGLEIIGVGYPGIRDKGDIRGLEHLEQSSSNPAPRILLFHTPTSIRLKDEDEFGQHFTTYWIPDTSFKLPRELGVDLQLSGHSHAGQIVPFGLLTRLIYKGYDYGLRREGDFSIYTTSGIGTWGPPMRTGNSPEIVAIRLILP
ncbi:MAG: metallophosphoesterase [Desulfobacterales bacterium]|nr:metallophosphoesterase [Desulfobacterales bacterium]